MTTKSTLLAAMLCVAATSSRALADDTDIDVRASEYLDVVETTDGSIWKGLVIEQTPGVEYKIATADGSVHVIKAADVVKLTKQRNKDYRVAAAPAAAPAADRGDGIARSADSGNGLPPPFVTSGVRLDPSVTFVFPAGDLNGFNTSFAPTVKVGYEMLFGNFGASAGVQTRFTYWMLPGGDSKDAMWTLEGHAYGQLALHLSRVSLHGGVSLGLDTNYAYVSAANMSKTTFGFGMNLMGGIDVAATKALAVTLGVDYHPGTDDFGTKMDGSGASISYVALLAGIGLRM